MYKRSYDLSPAYKTVRYSLTPLLAQQSWVYTFCCKDSEVWWMSHVPSASIYRPLCTGHGVSPRYSILSRTCCRNGNRKSVDFEDLKWKRFLEWLWFEFESLAYHILSVWPWKWHNFSKLQPHIGSMRSLIHLSQGYYESLMTMYIKCLPSGNFKEISLFSSFLIQPHIKRGKNKANSERIF